MFYSIMLSANVTHDKFFVPPQKYNPVSTVETEQDTFPLPVIEMGRVWKIM